MKREQGFSSVEVLIATGITMIILAWAMGSLKDGMGMQRKAVQIADVEQNLRAGMNLLARDFMISGWNIPTGGLPIPSGTGARPVVRPGASALSL